MSLDKSCTFLIWSMKSGYGQKYLVTSNQITWSKIWEGPIPPQDALQSWVEAREGPFRVVRSTRYHWDALDDDLNREHTQVRQQRHMRPATHWTWTGICLTAWIYTRDNIWCKTIHMNKWYQGVQGTLKYHLDHNFTNCDEDVAVAK